MNIYIQLTIAGTDVGPFDLYTDVGGFVSPYWTGISRADLVAGYNTTVPDGATQVKLQSTGSCTNSVIIDITVVTSTTTTSTSSSTTTTTSTSTTSIPPPTTTTTTTISGEYYKIFQCYTEVERIMEKRATNYHNGDWIRFSLPGYPAIHYCGTVIDENWLTGPADVILESPPPTACDDTDCTGAP